eukprot:357824-Chlamydomonas_euryale.AAC.1
MPHGCLMCEDVVGPFVKVGPPFLHLWIVLRIFVEPPAKHLAQVWVGGPWVELIGQAHKLGVELPGAHVTLL